ncbi:MAG TPA: DegV family protein [Eubacteriaceae bacterium]|nr:DegV family protein [Eubacteriaceae bacterium]
MSIQIIVDSGSDLPKEFTEKNNIKVVPLYVNIGDEEYLDGITIDSLELFNNMRKGAVYKTSQVSIKTFKEVFTQYAKENKKCIYISFSSELSGTYQASVMARREVLEEYPDFDIDVIDTKAASYGCGLIIKHVVELVNKGKTKPEILEALQFFINHIEHIFTVDSLEYLFRGGRVSRSSAFVGGLLNIKPILNMEDGKLIPLEKVRGRKKVIKRMVDIMEERGEDLANQTIGITHGDDLETAELFKELIQERFGTKDFVITMIGAVIGAHAGPGTIAIFFFNKEIPDKYK